MPLLIAPAMVRWVRTGSIAAIPATSKIVDHGRLPLATELRNNLDYGETQTPR
jgi:hypothetical protein